MPMTPACHVLVEGLGLDVQVSTIGKGSGAPMLFVPGGPCRGVEYLGDLAGLGDERPIVVLHPRGTPTSGGRSRGWWADAGDVIALADALGLESFDLVGHSAGTRLALATAAQFASRVDSLLLITPPATWLTGTPSDAETLASTYAEPAARGALPLLAADDPETESEFRELFLRQAPASYAQWGDAERAHSRVGEVSLRAATAWFDDIPSDAVAQILGARLPPIHVIGGGRDYLTGVQPVVDYAARLNATLSLLDRCGHYPWVEQPGEFRRAADDWIRARTAMGAGGVPRE